MTRQKLKHFAEMKTWSHVFEPTVDEPIETKGTWGDRVIVELGCGRGDYSLELARRFPDATVVAVDIKGSRMWHGAKAATEEGLTNIRFLRVRVEDLADYFAPGEVDEIWLTFSDPHPRKGKAKKRLSSPRFLKMYAKLLKPGGVVHLKTDSDLLYEYSLETVVQEGWTVLEHYDDVYAGKAPELLTKVQTQYEKRHLAEGRTIHHLSFA